MDNQAFFNFQLSHITVNNWKGTIETVMTVSILACI